MDDEDSVRKFVLVALRSFGNDVDEASDGAEAIEKYKKAMKTKKPFDVVIMDLTVPGGMGGQVAIKKLLEVDPNAKAVVSSGYGNDPVVSNFEAYGFKNYISKPYKIDELRKVLNEVLS
jgi:CheY-like chemotaxis protein